MHEIYCQRQRLVEILLDQGIHICRLALSIIWLLSIHQAFFTPIFAFVSFCMALYKHWKKFFPFPTTIITNTTTIITSHRHHHFCDFFTYTSFYCGSIVDGGLLDTAYVTHVTPSTSFVILLLIFSINS
jgi:hypothetical protein